jgi:hypothetical protein
MALRYLGADNEVVALPAVFLDGCTHHYLGLPACIAGSLLDILNEQTPKLIAIGMLPHLSAVSKKLIPQS